MKWTISTTIDSTIANSFLSRMHKSMGKSITIIEKERLIREWSSQEKKACIYMYGLCVAICRECMVLECTFYFSDGFKFELFFFFRSLVYRNNVSAIYRFTQTCLYNIL